MNNKFSLYWYRSLAETLDTTYINNDAMGLSKAAHMERVESTALAGAQGSCFAVIKQSAEHTGFINVHLDVRCQHSVVPHPVGPASHCCC